MPSYLFDTNHQCPLELKDPFKIKGDHSPGQTALQKCTPLKHCSLVCRAVLGFVSNRILFKSFCDILSLSFVTVLVMKMNTDTNNTDIHFAKFHCIMHKQKDAGKQSKQYLGYVHDSKMILKPTLVLKKVIACQSQHIAEKEAYTIIHSLVEDER